MKKTVFHSRELDPNQKDVTYVTVIGFDSDTPLMYGVSRAKRRRDVSKYAYCGRDNPFTTLTVRQARALFDFRQSQDLVTFFPEAFSRRIESRVPSHVEDGEHNVGRTFPSHEYGPDSHKPLD